MSMNTPLGSIDQTTPISSFTTLSRITVDQYLLGINSIIQGDGSKITLGNLIKSLVGDSEKNMLQVDEEGKLIAVAGANVFGQDNGWAVPPVLTIDWNTRQVKGTNGMAYHDGFPVRELTSFTSPAFPSGNGKYWLYWNTQTNALEWSSSFPNEILKDIFLICKVDIFGANDKFAAVRWELGGLGSSVREFLNNALGTLVLKGGQFDGVEVNQPSLRYPNISATSIGTVDFNIQLPALTTKHYNHVYASTTGGLTFDNNAIEIVPLSNQGVPQYVDNTGAKHDLASGGFMNVWVIATPLFASIPDNMCYQFVTGSVGYDTINDAKAASPTNEFSMQALGNHYDRYAIVGRFTISRDNSNWFIADFAKYNVFSGGGSGGGSGLTEVVSNGDFLQGLGTPSSPLDLSTYVKDKLDEVKIDVNNVYKILSGNKDANGRDWDIIDYVPNSHRNDRFFGSENFTTNTSSGNYHFYMLNNCLRNENNPSDAEKLKCYTLFNSTTTQTNAVLCGDATIAVVCKNKHKLSRIEFGNYHTSVLPTIITVSGANIPDAISREMTLSDLENYGKYIGGISQIITSNDDVKLPIGEPLDFEIDDSESYNVFFISLHEYSSGSGNGWDKHLSGIRMYGTQQADDSDYTVKCGGQYPHCKWVAANGNIYDTKDLAGGNTINIPALKEDHHLGKWISCFGSAFKQNATTRDPNWYYPCYIQGNFTCNQSAADGTYYGVLRQSNYFGVKRVDVGYNISAGRFRPPNTHNQQTVYEYTANALFPAGEYYWEGDFGFNSFNRHQLDRALVRIKFEDGTTRDICNFGHRGSMVNNRFKMLRTPRFYVEKAFKSFQFITWTHLFPNYSYLVNAMQLYYRDLNRTIDRSFKPSFLGYDGWYNTLRHKQNLHFFLTPTGVRVGSNCFVDTIDPPLQYACVGNRWINENTRKSWVCNQSGVWVEEDFCEVMVMIKKGSEAFRTRHRSVFNDENPLVKYVHQDSGCDGHLHTKYVLTTGIRNKVDTAETDDPFFFLLEALDTDQRLNIELPAGATIMTSARMSVQESPVFPAGVNFNIDYTNVSNGLDHGYIMCQILKAWKSFDVAGDGFTTRESNEIT